MLLYDGCEIISIHAPARGATQCLVLCFVLPVFQSTRPQGARPHLPLAISSRCIFQSTRPQGARRYDPYTELGIRNFNPRARKGRDYFGKPISEWIVISIHAPARGATPPEDLNTLEALFQSTRPQGARHFLMIFSRRKCYFNPRARKGRDRIADQKEKFAKISIHAPARGATCFIRFSAFARIFQSTRPQGARRVSSIFRSHKGLFQSTRPQGARRMPGNPCPHRQISIHAPARGATGPMAENRGRLQDFNPRARKGRDTKRPKQNTTTFYFNPRARKGRDMKHLDRSGAIAISIHAPARGATGCLTSRTTRAYFNPRARKGRDGTQWLHT